MRGQEKGRVPSERRRGPNIIVRTHHIRQTAFDATHDSNIAENYAQG